MLYFGCDEVLSFDGEAVDTLSRARKLRCTRIGTESRWPPLGRGCERDRVLRENGQRPFSLSFSRWILAKSARELGDVWQVFVSDNAAVFVTATTLLVWNGDGFQIFPMPGARRLLAMQAEGKIFVTHLPTGLWSLERDGPHMFISADALKNSGVVWIRKDAKGWLLCTSDGLRRFDEGKVTEFAPDANDFIRKNVLTSACVSPKGELCIGTLYGGVAILSPSGSVERVITMDDGLPARGIFSLFFSGDGALWTTSGVGIARIAFNSGTTLFDASKV